MRAITGLIFRSRSLKGIPANNKQNGLWTAEPGIWSIIGYSVLIPVVSALGIIGNSLILAVHVKAKTYLKSSTYTYLAGRCGKPSAPAGESNFNAIIRAHALGVLSLRARDSVYAKQNSIKRSTFDVRIFRQYFAQICKLTRELCKLYVGFCVQCSHPRI